jgi:3D (Asp-Asp-Asp) domain-containing protein
MRYKAKLIIIAILMCLVSCGATRGEPVNSVDTSQMQKMYTTAYCLHGVTANGGTTRPHIAACNPHLGDVAIIYSVDGEYLYTAEITDKGTTNGLIAGSVIDVWFDTYEEAVAWMLKVADSGGKCKVLFIKGQG